MERRIHLYTSRKNAAVWLMALCMLASVVMRAIVFAGSGNVWSLIVLPVAASVLYALITILSGKEMFYKTAIPVWILGISGALQTYTHLQGHPFQFAMACTCILFGCMVYTVITSGQLRFPWLLLPLYLAVLAAIGYIHWQFYLYTQQTEVVRYVLPDYLLVLGMLVLLFGLKIHTDGNYHPTWGDRIDGRRIRSIPALDQISPYIMVNRTGANNLFSESVEITEVERYIRHKRREGLTSFGLTHVIMAA